MPRGTDKSILAALRWLKKAQEPDGRWNCRKWGGSTNADAGVTGLALLAFLGYGCTDKQPREFADTVRKAMGWLVNRQVAKDGKNEGWFRERMYSQGICTMALCEASAMMPRQRKIKAAAQRGLDYILRNQPAHGAYGYTGPGDDVSVTGFQIQAIKSAYIADLKVPKEARERTERFLDICMAKNYSTPYRIKPRMKVQPGSGKTTMTAASLTGRLFMGHRRTDPDCEGQAKFLTHNDRHLAAAKGRCFYEIYYYSLSMFNMGGKYWKDWNKAFNGPLRAKQEMKGPEKGSWPPKGARYGGHGGRVYTTAMACLALEVYFRYLPTYKSL
jgi:hypothetical protein